MLTGTIAADGSFSLSSPARDTVTALTVQGTVPSSAGASWPGKYSFSATPLTPTNAPACVSLDAPFDATSIQNLSGTYTGTSARLPGIENSLTATPITMSLALQQGGMFYSPLAAVPVNSELALEGSIQIQGFSCFSKGTASTSLPNNVAGSRINVNFLMDDGSTLQVLGSILDTGARRLSVDSVSVRGGQCAGAYLFLFNPLIVQR